LCFRIGTDSTREAIHDTFLTPKTTNTHFETTQNIGYESGMGIYINHVESLPKSCGRTSLARPLLFPFGRGRIF
jgi:hypothetical protein